MLIYYMDGHGLLMITTAISEFQMVLPSGVIQHGLQKSPLFFIR